ncbi:hypothetical protein [Naasia lichenicola]|uniref:DUF4190 domain-containing protein n=1 Tax=Naasia lichenicola TaxID=2565933 RepID=A0A4S4FTQ6_9MICO|nr:hypothetical protein [Naasia lichenicola]THG33362.1 hypothetical protein E6C64_03145 [Naasia lichenicola]
MSAPGDEGSGAPGTNPRSDGTPPVARLEAPAPLDVPGRRSSFVLSLVALLLFAFPPVCLILSVAAGILAVRTLRLMEKGSSGRWMPMSAIAIALVGVLWGAGVSLFLLLNAG